MKALRVTAFSAIFCLSIFLASQAETEQEIPIDAEKKAETEKEIRVEGEREEVYEISKGDLLEISVYEEDDLSGQFKVKEDGTISYPLLGTVPMLGLSEIEAEKKIASLLRERYLVDPHVKIAVKEYHERITLVLGSVNKPGSYPFPEDRPLTFLEAISRAGGFSRYASPSGTRITRTMRGGKKKVIKPRVKDIISGRIDDVELEPGDIISVPERFF